jgi:hypothetical protein
MKICSNYKVPDPISDQDPMQFFRIRPGQKVPDPDPQYCHFQSRSGFFNAFQDMKTKLIDTLTALIKDGFN